MASKGRRIVRRSLNSRVRDRTNWKELWRLTDKDIEHDIARDPDAAPLLSAAWFETARVVDAFEKETITLRLDKNTLEFFRQLGPRYEAYINIVLRAFVAQTRRRRKPGLPAILR